MSEFASFEYIFMSLHKKKLAYIANRWGGGGSRWNVQVKNDIFDVLPKGLVL